ncbi:MAG: pyridoxal-phosphate dependent enzyme [Bacteroidales bacterium]|nr:pyridoxal-phosphate dependent enzyme [Bacteroidales bacterium]
MMDRLPLQEDITNARALIASYVHRTPVHSSISLDEICGCRLLFKCENFQKGGAFKYRGATHALLQLAPEEIARGVATHSSGNHAQALSLAARTHGTEAFIVMPQNAPKIKVEAVTSYGGHITFCQPTLADREAMLEEVIKETNAVEIHPYNNYHIIAGQATAAAELFEDADAPDCLIAPVGGGGLLSGCILSAKYFSPSTRVYGAEPEKANDAWKSFRQKKLIPVDTALTIADGLRTSLGSKTFPIIAEGAEDILCVSEEGIIKAMLLIWERMKIIAEPSAAVPLAAVLEHPELFRAKRIGIILSGGNTDLFHLPWTEHQLSGKH